MRNMRMVFAIFAVCTLGICVFSCNLVRGADKMVTYPVELDPFDRIKASDGVDVEVRYGAACSVTVTANDNLAKYINVVRNDGTLVIFLKNNCLYSNCTVCVDIAMPILRSLAVADSANARISGFPSSDTVSLSAGDSSGISGSLECGILNLKLSDSSVAALQGSANDLNLFMIDLSKANLDDFPVQRATIELSDRCMANISASSRISGSLIDNSRLYYSGSPSTSVAMEDGSNIIRR